VNGQIGELQEKRGDLTMERAKVTQEMQNIDRQIQNLRNVADQRLNFLRDNNKDAYNATLWLRQHANEFNATVHDPILTVINVKDPKHAKYVERLVPYKDMVCFVCEDQEDMLKVTKVLRDEKGYRNKYVMMPQQQLQSFRPPARSQLGKFGFHSYVRDLFTAPDAVMRYLCANYNAHTVLVGDQTTTSQAQHIVDSMNGPGMFFSENISYSVKVSRYGNKVKSTTQSDLRPARLLVTSGDMNRLHDLQGVLQQRQKDLQDLDTKMASLMNSLKKKEEQQEELRNRKKDLIHRRDRRKHIENEIKHKKNSIQKEENNAVDIQAERIKCDADIEQVQKAKCSQPVNMANILKKIVSLQEELSWQNLHISVSDREVLQARGRLQEAQSDLRDLEAEIREAADHVQDGKQECTRLIRIAEESTGIKVNSNNMPQVFDQLPNTLEEIDSKIRDHQSRVDSMVDTGDNVLRDFEEVKRELQRKEEKLSRLIGSKGSIEAEVAAVRARWLPPLNALVVKINTNFTRFFKFMGCSGEVILSVPDEQDEYDKYGINIRVKFRDNDQLRDLGQRQSGGERSVSTILYVMALQELTKVPFRCVDEINQGMDAMNERRIFDLVVDVSAKTESQYFLLTPKLLKGLNYAEHMNVLCIYNGAQTLSFKDWDLGRILQKQGRIKQQQEEDSD